MKENKYDDKKFFDQYSAMRRSTEGLSAAGEWHELESMLPRFEGKRVLDIGCGFGWHCAYAAEHGALSVVGTDISEKMLETAAEKHSSDIISYRRVAMEDLDYADGSFDIVLSSLAFHYTADFSTICEKVYRFLSQGGVFVFSAEHPVFTACGLQRWVTDNDGNRLHWPVDRYFYEGKREALFLGEEIIKYHRTIGAYVGGLLSAGFVLTGLSEPKPPAEMLESVEGMMDELRRPMMLIIRAEKR